MSAPIHPKHISLLWALAENAGDIAAAHAELFPEAWDQAAILTLLEHPGATALLARASGKAPIAGFILGRIVGDEAEILSLGVRPAYQRLGVAKQLVGGLVRAVQRAEVKRLFLEVADDNVAALALYRGLGLGEVGRRKAYYKRPTGPARDALTLALDIA